MNTGGGGLKIKLNLGRAPAPPQDKSQQDGTAIGQEQQQNGSLGSTKLKLKLGSVTSLQNSTSVPFSPSGFHASDQAFVGEKGRGAGKKKSRGASAASNGRGKAISGIKRKEGSGAATVQEPGQGVLAVGESGSQPKKIKLSTGGKIKLSLKNLTSKVFSFPAGGGGSAKAAHNQGGQRGRGRGRGRGRPPGRTKKPSETDDNLIQQAWEDELLLVSNAVADDDDDKVTRGPGRRPKQMTGSTPATQEGISILIEKIWDRDYDDLFKYPVTDEEAPGYSDMISNPMDLSTMKGKNVAGAYSTWEELAMDIQLMFKNALKYNSKGSDVWKSTKTQQMYARTLIENARRGKMRLNAKAKAANAARKETIAAKVHAREKRNAVLKKARAEQKAAQEAKILKRAGVDVDDNTSYRSSFRKRTDGMHHNHFQGLAASKTGDGVYIGFFNPSFALGSRKEPTVVAYAESLKHFCASLSSKAFEKVSNTMVSMFPKYYRYDSTSNEISSIHDLARGAAASGQ